MALQVERKKNQERIDWEILAFAENITQIRVNNIQSPRKDSHLNPIYWIIMRYARYTSLWQKTKQKYITIIQKMLYK